MPDVLIYIINSLLAYVAYYCYITLNDHFLVSRFSFFGRKPLYATIVALLIIITPSFMPPLLRTLRVVIIYLLVPILLYRGKIFSKLLSAVIQFVLGICSESAALLPAPYFGWDITISTYANLCIVTSFSFIFYLIMALFIRNIVQLIDNRLNFRIEFQLVIAIMCFSLTSLWQLLHVNIDSFPPFLIEHAEQIHFISAMLSLFALHAMISLIHTLNTSIRETETAKMRENSMQYELRHYQALAAKDSSYLKLRHDFKNHLLAIDALIKAGEYDRLQDYSNHLSESLFQYEPHIYCGHLLIDSILNTKEQVMKDNHITIKHCIDPMPEYLHIRDIDLCALLGNLIDNAIEACLHIENPSLRYINISLQHSDNAFILQIENSSNKSERTASDRWSMSWKQKERKGIGLPICRQITEQYNGSFSIRTNDLRDSVIVNVILPDAI